MRVLLLSIAFLFGVWKAMRALFHSSGSNLIPEKAAGGVFQLDHAVLLQQSPTWSKGVHIVTNVHPWVLTGGRLILAFVIVTIFLWLYKRGDSGEEDA